jgi:Undecaprenyl-phosphate glucose phosphotransferase
MVWQLDLPIAKFTHKSYVGFDKIMTRRSINLIQFWLTIALFSVPAMAFGTAGYLRFKSGYFSYVDVDVYPYLVFTVLVTLLWAFIVDHLRLNKMSTLLTLRTGIRTASLATVYCAVLALSLAFFYRAAVFARVFVIVGCCLMFGFSFAMIHLFRWIMHSMERSSNGRFPIAILGADRFAKDVAGRLSDSSMARCNVACFVALPDQDLSPFDAPVLKWEQLDEVVDVFHCRELLIALPPERLGEAKKLLQVVQHLCIPSRLVLDLGEGIFLPERIFDYYGIPLLDVRPYPIDTVGYALGKRIFDVIFSLSVLTLTSPILLLITLLIKLTSRGPVLFAQERVSLNGRRFTMLKFRTMFLQDSKDSDSMHTLRDDQRVTAVGRLLRRFSFDELPQFFNVLNGDMSVVGPRPELTFFVQKFRQEIPSYMSRHNVKCGITGWAQVNGLRGSDTSMARRIQFDLYYLRHWSIGFDVKIIFLTLFGIAHHQAY